MLVGGCMECVLVEAYIFYFGRAAGPEQLPLTNYAPWHDVRRIQNGGGNDVGGPCGSRDRNRRCGSRGYGVCVRVRRRTIIS